MLITQAHCEICAVTPEDVQRADCDILASKVLALSAGTAEGIFDGIMSIANFMDHKSIGVGMYVGYCVAYKCWNG